MALCREIVDLMRLHLLDDANQIRCIGEIAVVENHSATGVVRVAVQVVDSVGVEGRRASLHAMHLVTLVQQ